MKENDEFQKKAFELWMAVTMFMSTYAKESNGIVRNVSEMLPYATDLQEFWNVYQNAESNELIRKLHSKIRARVKLMQDKIGESIRLCGDNQKLLDKYSENQGYIEAKLKEVYELIPKKPRTVAEPVQLTLDFDSAPAVKEEEPSSSDTADGKDELTAKSEKFLKRMNELRNSVNGFLSSYSDSEKMNSVVSYMSDMDESIKVVDSLWRRYVKEPFDEQILDGINTSMRKCIASMRSQCDMSVLVRDSCRCADKYAQNHDYVVKKLNDFVRAFPDGIRNGR